MTAERIAQAKRLRKRGLSIAAIARELGASKSTVHAALERKPPRKLPPAPPAVQPAPVALDVEAPTVESLARDLATQLDELREDARRARTARDSEALNRANKHSVTTATVLARLTRDAPAADGVVHVTADAIAEAAQQCRDALHDLVARELERQGVSR